MSGLRLLLGGVIVILAVALVEELHARSLPPRSQDVLAETAAFGVGTRLDAPVVSHGNTPSDVAAAKPDEGAPVSPARPRGPAARAAAAEPIASPPAAPVPVETRSGTSPSATAVNRDPPASARAPQPSPTKDAVPPAAKAPDTAAEIPPPATPALPEKKVAAGPAKEQKPAVAKDEKPRALTFDTLGDFEFVEPDPGKPKSLKKAAASIPDEVKALDGKLVSIEGYMLPLEYASEDGREVGSFILTRAPLVACCCYGSAPRTNEMIHVTIAKGKGVRNGRYNPVTITGTLHVGVDQIGRASLIYFMDSPKVVVAEEDSAR